MNVLAELTALHFLFGGAGLLSLLAFGALILAPTIGSFGRTWERITAALLSLFVLVVLVAMGAGFGILIVYNWDSISGWFG